MCINMCFAVGIELHCVHIEPSHRISRIFTDHYCCLIILHLCCSYFKEGRVVSVQLCIENITEGGTLNHCVYVVSL